MVEVAEREGFERVPPNKPGRAEGSTRNKEGKRLWLKILPIDVGQLSSRRAGEPQSEHADAMAPGLRELKKPLQPEAAKQTRRLSVFPAGKISLQK